MTSHRIVAFAGIVVLALAGCDEPDSNPINDTSIFNKSDMDEFSTGEGESGVDIGAIAESAVSETSSSIEADMNSSGHQ